MHNANMLALNWIDLIILVLLLGAGYLSAKIGSARLFGVIVGFFGALFLAGWIVPHLLPIKDKTLMAIINANLVLLIALYAGAKCYDLGNKFKISIKRKFSTRAEGAIGAMIGCLAVLMLIWMGAVGLARMPFAGLSNSVNDAFTIQELNSVLPPIPAIFTRFSQTVDPNSEPRVFSGKQSNPSLVTPPLSEDLRMASDKASQSTVRMTGFGCGGIVSGSGYVVAPNLVVTNAHVIAGVKRPIIKDGDKSFEGTPILFNTSLDIAILKADGMNNTPLLINEKPLKSNDHVAVLGFPKGNFAANPGVIVSRTQIFSTNIYGVGTIPKEVYDVQFDVKDGISGGPMIRPDGEVGGIVFSRAHDIVDHGYILTSKELKPLVEQATKTNRKVSTGACLLAPYLWQTRTGLNFF